MKTNKENQKNVRVIRILAGAIIMVMLIFVSGCAKKPQVEIDAANNALKEAKNSGADVYMAAEFTAVRDSLAAVLGKVSVQESKTFKKYAPLKAELTAITKQANDLAGKAATRAKEVMRETQNLLARTKSAEKTNEALMENLSRREKKSIDFEKVEAEQKNAVASLNEAYTLFGNGSYMEANNKVKAASQKIKDINKQLTQAKK